MVEDGEFVWHKPAEGSVPAKLITFKWLTDTGPEGKPHTFPGKRYELLMVPQTDVPEGKEPGTRQQSRARI